MIYRFGDCVLDKERYELRRADAVVIIEPKVFQVLVYLIQHRDCVVTRDELLEHCWPGTFVSESALTQCLARVRKAVGDHRGGLVAYFGHPQAHEDDIQRGIRAGLCLVEALQKRPVAYANGQIAVRVGIHTGPVVVGEIGGGRHDPLAVGETLTIGARLKDLAEPGMVVISATTARLVEGYFLWQEKAVPPLPWGDQGLVAYHVLGESETRSRLDIVAKQRRLTPFVGRETEWWYSESVGSR